MSLIVARPVLVPEPTFEQEGLAFRRRIVNQTAIVVTARASGFAVALVNIGIRPADIRPVTVSEEHVNA
jgi:hypothetical protein